MKPNGYKVEFFPLERRLLDRRFIESAPSFFGHERRLNERRELDDKEIAGSLNLGLNTPRALTH